MSLGKAAANATKSFFVRMLTRDISLDDCILDLVDNSIDGAWEISGSKPSLAKSSDLINFRIDIRISEDSFSIVDNCGGITLDEAAEYAFTFGRQDDLALNDDEFTAGLEAEAAKGKDDDGRSQYSVGVYGIGMKRAIFKIGRKINIRSTYAGKGGTDEAFEVPIDVRAWLADRSRDSWDFTIEPADPLPERGVKIEVTDLALETKTAFRDPTYVTDLRDVLARDYMLPLMHGLQINLNEKPVVGRRLELRAGSGFTPMRDVYTDGGVAVEILAGMAAPPPDDSAPDESDRTKTPSGWYVLCNGRVVLAADTTTTTGWGVELPRWHPQYAGFLGLVLFTSPHAVLLPMTTTKRGVDVSSGVYLRARGRMAPPARAWIDYTNARKSDAEVAKSYEERSHQLIVSDVVISPSVQLPVLQKKKAERTANINYARPLRRVQQLAKGFGDINLTYRDVGIQSFEYAFSRLADEEDDV